MEGFENKYLDVRDWEITCIGDEYYRMLRESGHTMSETPLDDRDLEQLVDVYHYWKILLGCSAPRLDDMNEILHCLHFDVIIELFLHRKLREAYRLKNIF